MKWRWWKIVSAQLAYSLFSPLFSRFPEKLLRLGHGATPQFATNSARVTADIYLRAYIALHKYTIKNTQIQKYKYTNTQKQIHTNSARVTSDKYLRAYIALHCSKGHIFKEYWWDCRKYANTDTAKTFTFRTLEWVSQENSNIFKERFSKTSRKCSNQYSVKWTLNTYANLRWNLWT